MNDTDIRKLVSEEDAVSPVIGVILMVAITVILAAVIGTFVLGLGDQVQSSAPNANFEFSYSNNSSTGTGAVDTVSITHNGGQDVERSAVSVQIGPNTAYESGSTTSGFAISNSEDFSTTIATGSTLSIVEDTTDIAGGQTVRIIWQSPNGGNSNTIGQSTVPN